MVLSTVQFLIIIITNFFWLLCPGIFSTLLVIIITLKFRYYSSSFYKGNRGLKTIKLVSNYREIVELKFTPSLCSKDMLLSTTTSEHTSHPHPPSSLTRIVFLQVKQYLLQDFKLISLFLPGTLSASIHITNFWATKGQWVHMSYPSLNYSSQPENLWYWFPGFVSSWAMEPRQKAQCPLLLRFASSRNPDHFQVDSLCHHLRCVHGMKSIRKNSTVPYRIPPGSCSKWGFADLGARLSGNTSTNTFVFYMHCWDLIPLSQEVSKGRIKWGTVPSSQDPHQ